MYQKTPTKVSKDSKTIKKDVVKSAAKSILKMGAKRGRSKSVTFDLSIDAINDEPNIQKSLPWVPRSVEYNRNRSKSVLLDPQNVTPVKMVRRQLFANQNGPINGSAEKVQITPDGQSNEVESITDESPIDIQVAHYVDVQTDVKLIGNGAAQCVDAQTESGTTESQARIKALVESNRLKINRIKEMTGEKAILLKDMNVLNNMNKSMAATIDAFREDDNRLESEVCKLRQRIDTINRENFDLMDQNQRMKAILGTYSAKVLAEHNYNK